MKENNFKLNIWKLLLYYSYLYLFKDSCVLFPNTWSFTILYLVSPGRKEIGMFSWQPWPGCQLDLQTEQNSMSQALHWTSWGFCGLDSWSWQTAWQVEDGHQVRQGSKSTSGQGHRRKKFKGPAFHNNIFQLRLTGRAFKATHFQRKLFNLFYSLRHKPGLLCK